MPTWLARLILFAFLVFGVATLHYNESTGAPHHRVWAVEHGMPEPAWRLWLVGVVMTIAGSAALGVSFARRGR